MNIEVNIGGAFSQKEFLLRYFLANKDITKEMQITVYDGVNTCPWNGGRINRNIQYTDDVINFYYRNNISIALTFTNNVISLDDPTGNHLLNKFHRPGNKIISIIQSYVIISATNFHYINTQDQLPGLGK